MPKLPLPNPKRKHIKSKETSSTKDVKAPSFVFDKDVLRKRLTDIIENLSSKYGGKPGYNPYLWIHSKVEPLLRRLDADPPETTKALHDAIMALPLDYIPTIEIKKSY